MFSHSASKETYFYENESNVTKKYKIKKKSISVLVKTDLKDPYNFGGNASL